MARNMNPEQQFNCIFCQEVFDDKEAFQIHFRKHADPNFNSNKTKINLQNENRVSTETPKKDVEMVGCDVCSEVFTTISKAITHKHKVHPDHDTKYFCPWCGKLFTLKHLYNKHLETNHNNRGRTDETSFHCDCCDVDFWVPAAMMYHNKFFHRQDTDIPAFGHSKKLKTYNQEAIQIYYCSFCGEEFENKVNLHKHTIDDHSDENQSPDDVLRCSLCDAIFYHLDAYELHLTFHSTEDLYSEKNDMMKAITEFSLESVPPIMEKVENCEPQQDVETTMNEVGIDRFLEVAMEEPSVEGKKSKKHKKHKKSKKPAITLDEFLNMNTDVFGEGLDFQGIEEVPTQAITKRLKVYKNPPKSNPELEKLRRQGIVIKKKPGRKLLSQSNKTIPTKSLPITKLGTSDEVLSKLLSQSNNQIKIVKKSSQQNKNEVISQESDMLEEKDPRSPETNEMECDTTKKELGLLPQTSEIDNIKDESKDNATLTRQQDNSEVSDKHASQDSQHTSDCLSPNENSKKSNKVGDNLVHNNKDEHNIDKNYESSNCSEGSEKDNAIVASSVQSPIGEKKKDSNPLNALLNTGHITIKTASNNTKDTTEIIHNNKNNVDGTDSDHDVIDDSTKNNTEKDNDASNSSLSAFKHLSHVITIKPVNESKNSTQIEAERDEKRYPKVSPVNLNVNTRDTEDSTVTSTQAIKEAKTVKKNSQDNELTLDSLKNLGINITLKSSTQSPKSVIAPSEFNDDPKIGDNITDPRVNVSSQNKSSINTNISSGKFSSTASANSPKLNKQSNHSPILGNRSTTSKIIEDVTIKKEPSANILKHLTNITAKPISTKNVAPHVTSSIQSKNTNNKMIQESMEIFNIDDSDSDEMDSDLEKNKANESQTIGALKNISKNVTVKPVNQFGKQINKMHNLPLDSTSQDENRTNIYKSNYNRSCEHVTKSATTKCVTETVVNEKSAALKNVLKNLGKNITVQSRTSSPSLSLKGQDQNSQDSKIEHDDEGDSDSDSYSGNIKITELENDDSIDDEIKNNEACINALVQSPSSSCSDNEINSEGNFNEENEEESDIESHIKINTLKKADNNTTSMKNATCLNNLKNISRNITIKSFNENTADKEDDMSKLYTTPEIAKNLGRQISIKPTRQVKKDVNNISNRNLGHSSNEVFTNQNVSTSNQMNTVNKEVTVKTFQTQTKTVIQEITTTVTKTIKTVNQTSKQEVRNMTQSNTSVVQQKAQGMRPYQPPHNLQGITVRNTVPNLGSKIRNSTPIRQALNANVRVPNQAVPMRLANQMVPMRPRSNVARLSSPRVAATPRLRPSIPNQIHNNTERPLKVSPNAIISQIKKRPSSDDHTGPFSCFKKPKESLIPVSDVPTISNNGGELRAEYSASHISKSNFTSTTRTVKGGSTVTSTQTKSEMSASSQQLSKLSNKSGLRVVKANQTNQTQESCEVSTSNRSTLEAIQKLQKQGLLVKKPRIDVSENSERFDPGGEDNVNYSSSEENDDY